MKQLGYILAGMFFGIVVYKGEVISWFRIQEMFRFHSFHMYGIIFTAIAVGAISVRIMTRSSGEPIAPKALTRGTWIGGVVFGMGWALTGACPGPLYAHIGAGTSVMLITIASALLGVWTYALLRPFLPR